MKLSSSTQNFTTAGISIIIPAKNEDAHIGKCISSLLNQNFPGPFEILVLDNCSTDKTVEIVRSKGIKIVSTNANTAAAVRNMGALKAKHKILAFIDGDCEAPANWIINALGALNTEKRIIAAGGPYVAPIDANWIAKSWSPCKNNHTRMVNKSLPGSNIIVLKKIFDQIGGFNSDLITAEDDDLCKRLIKRGYFIDYDSKRAVIHHGSPKNIYDLLKKSIWHGATQLKAHGFWSDKMVRLTWLWLFSVILFFFFLTSLDTLLLSLTLVLIFTSPALLSTVRLKNAPLDYKFKYFLPTYLVSLTVLLGRSIGMVREIGLFLKAYMLSKKSKFCKFRAVK